ncbi:MAG: HD-GYP domain-containing protein [Campylobacterota bacterium]|nr:HD-GYP domain-containing protein [Campylobacterota bacterium]
MVVKGENIVISFYKRALFSMFFISILSSVSIYYFQQYNFYTSLANEIKVHVDKGMKSYNQNLKLSSQEKLEEDVKSFMRKLGFISIEIYDDKKVEFFSFDAKGKRFEEQIKLIEQHDEYLVHNFPESKKMSQNFFEVEHKQHFLQVFYPLYKGDKLLGYIEGIKYVEPIVVNRFKRGIVATIVTVILTITIFSLVIFPLIYFAYKKINQNRLDLLSSNIMTINTLGNAIALRDSDTNEHNYRVTLYSIKLAEQIELDKEYIKKLIVGAFLHDVGKIGIPDGILLKNGKLTSEEFEIMKEHVLKGIQLVQGNPWLENSKDVILCHHEKYDGTGYPNQIKGDDIPIIARIFSIVDVFDALTSKRPYKEPFSYDKTLQILNDSSGTHFDKKLLSEFENISNKLYTNTKSKTKEQLKDELDSLIKKYFLEN